MKRIISFTALLFTLSFAYCERDSASSVESEQWSLEKCITYALSQNLNVADQIINVQRAENAYYQDKSDRLPVLNGSASNNYNFGRSIDPFTNQYVTQSIRSNNFSLTSSATVYNGKRITNTIQRSNNEINRAKLQSQTIENQVALSVADAFLQIVFAKNQLTNFEVINQSTTTQLEQAKKLYEAGATNQRQYLNLKAQDARDKMNIQNANGSIRMAHLRLQQIMQLESDDFEIKSPAIGAVSIESKWSVIGIINNAISTMPDIKLAEAQLRTSEISIDISKSAFYPRLSMFVNVNTLYSESRLQRFNPQKTISPIGYVDGTNETVFTEFTSYDTKVSAFGQQLNDNFGQAAGLSLSIPIFNNNQARAGVSESKLVAQQAKNNVERTRLSLRMDILQAYTDFENSVAAYESAQENESAQKENYDFVLKSSNAGVATTAEMILALNDWSQAKNDLERARFQLVYSRTILNFYNTGEVTIATN
jgi:outer membrane protein